MIGIEPGATVYSERGMGVREDELRAAREVARAAASLPDFVVDERRRGAGCCFLEALVEERDTCESSDERLFYR
jgi:hypothetical protein